MSKGLVVLAVVARVLLGLGFVVFGLNGLLHFIHMSMPGGHAGSLMSALATSGYLMQLVAVTQIVGGLAVLSGRWLPLGLVLLAPVLVNILMFHLALAPSGIVAGAVLTLFEVFLAWEYRDAFRPMFHAHLHGAT